MEERLNRIKLLGYDPLDFSQEAQAMYHHKVIERAKRGYVKARVEAMAPELYAQGLNDCDMGKILFPGWPKNKARQAVFRWRQEQKKPANQEAWRRASRFRQKS